MNDMETPKEKKTAEELVVLLEKQREAAKAAAEKAAAEKKEKLDAMYKKYKDRFQFRPLRDDDMYTIIRLVELLLPEAGIRDAFASVVLGNATAAQVGARVMVEMIISIMKNAEDVKEDVYAFLSDLAGITPEKIKSMPFGTTPAMLWALANDAKSADFFEDVSMLL